MVLCLAIAGFDRPPPTAAAPPIVHVAVPTIADTDIVREFVGAVAATLLGIFVVPVLYAVVQRLSERFGAQPVERERAAAA